MADASEHSANRSKLIQEAMPLMIAALELLDLAGAHQSAALLDHSIRVLPDEHEALCVDPDPISKLN